MRQVSKVCSNLHQPLKNLSNIMTHWPFTYWGLDILGPFSVTKAHKKFMTVAFEYFTTWVEVEASATITHMSMEKFL